MARVPLFPPLVTTRTAREEGITRARLRGPSYTRVAHGRYVPSGADLASVDAQIAVVGTGLSPSAAIGGWAAARIHERSARPQGDELVVFDGVLPSMDRSARRQVPVLVCASRRSRVSVPLHAEVLRSDIGPDETVVIAGVRVTSAIRTSFDLLRTWPTVPAVVSVDRMANLGLVELEQLAAVVDARGGWRGIRQARRSLTLADGRAESPRESMMRLVWRSAGLPVPRANGVVRDEGGRFVARVDLIDDAAGVVAEYDGAFHAGMARRQADAARHEVLDDLGVVVVRMTEPDLATPSARAAWQERLRAAYRRAGERPRGSWQVTYP